MSTQRLAYDDADTAQEMHRDGVACAARLPRLAAPRSPAELAVEGPPSILYADYPREIAKPEITVSAAAAALAARLHLD